MAAGLTVGVWVNTFSTRVDSLLALIMWCIIVMRREKCGFCSEMERVNCKRVCSSLPHFGLGPIILGSILDIV